MFIKTSGVLAPAGSTPDHSPRRPLALVGLFVGSVGFAAAVTAIYIGMRDVMITAGGFCASGGPYVVANQCSEGQIALMTGGMFAIFVFGGILLASSSGYGGTSFGGTALLMWAALFGALGFNFMQLGIDPPQQTSAAWSWIICGVVFWIMALPGLILGLREVIGFIRRGDNPEPPMFDAPLVMANVPPANPTPPPRFGPRE